MIYFHAEGKNLNHLKRVFIALISLCFLFTASPVFAWVPPTGEKGKVTNLNATHKNHVVTLTWDWNKDDEYTILRNGEVRDDNVTGGEYEDTYMVKDDITYTYTVWANGSEEKASIDIVIEKDTTPPPNVIPKEPILLGNHFVNLLWNNSEYTFDGDGVDIFVNGNLVDDLIYEPAGAKVTGLEEGTEYTFSFCSKDKSGNVTPLEDCAKQVITTTRDYIAPAEVKDWHITFVSRWVYDWYYEKEVKDEYMNFTWERPNDKDYAGSIITFPNGERYYFDNFSFKYRPKNMFMEQKFIMQSVDFNGNISDGKVYIWDHPKRPPGEVSNIKIVESKGMINISFTPPKDNDYFYTQITLPGGKVVQVKKGSSKYSYKGTFVVGQTYDFLLQSSDGWNNAKGIKQTIKPKATIINKYHNTKTSTKLKSLTDGKGKFIKSISKGKKVYVYSTGYGTNHDYVFVKYDGKYKGYIPKSAVKF